MAVEQDWAAYADQAYLNDTDTLLARTAVGAGVEVPATAFAKKSSSGHFGFGTTNPLSRLDALEASRIRWYLGNSLLVNIEITNGAADTYVTHRVQAYDHQFYTNGVQRAVISNSGNSGFGTASPGARVHAYSPDGTVPVRIESAGAPDSIFLSVNQAGVAGDGVYVMPIRTAGTLRGGIQWNGSSLLYNTSSDYRLKEDLIPLTGSLDRILALPVYDFRWKESGKRTRGFLAHEYGEAFPDAVTGEKDAMREEEVEIEPERLSDVLGKDGTPVTIPAVTEKRMVPDYQGIDQAKAVPDLVAAVQELHAIVLAQAARIAALEGAA